MIVTELVAQFSHDVHIWYPQVLEGGAYGPSGGRGLTPRPHGVQLGPQWEVQDYIMLMATNDSIEIKLELGQVEISWR